MWGRNQNHGRMGRDTHVVMISGAANPTPRMWVISSDVKVMISLMSLEAWSLNFEVNRSNRKGEKEKKSEAGPTYEGGDFWLKTTKRAASDEPHSMRTRPERLNLPSGLAPCTSRKGTKHRTMETLILFLLLSSQFPSLSFILQIKLNFKVRGQRKLATFAYGVLNRPFSAVCLSFPGFAEGDPSPTFRSFSSILKLNIYKRSRILFFLASLPQTFHHLQAKWDSTS